MDSTVNRRTETSFPKTWKALLDFVTSGGGRAAADAGSGAGGAGSSSGSPTTTAATTATATTATATAITAAAALDPTVHFACAVGRAANQPTVWLEENSLV